MADGPIELMVYFGWVWEPSNSADVSTVTMADGAEVDLSLGNVGGDAPGMQGARTAIAWCWLHAHSRRVLTKEASWWLGIHGGLRGSDQFLWNREAIVDFITRAANSSWWDWSDGSRLFFWQWPEVWHLEARDGAKSYRSGEPPPRLHFPRLPDQEL